MSARGSYFNRDYEYDFLLRVLIFGDAENHHKKTKADFNGYRTKFFMINFENFKAHCEKYMRIESPNQNVLLLKESMIKDTPENQQHIELAKKFIAYQKPESLIVLYQDEGCLNAESMRSILEIDENKDCVLTSGETFYESIAEHWTKKFVEKNQENPHIEPVHRIEKINKCSIM